MKYKKKYLVIFQDEYNNLYYIGKYNNLNEPISDLNDYLGVYNVSLKEGDLKEYSSTFGNIFDLCIDDLYEDREDLCGIMIRGFILMEEDDK